MSIAEENLFSVSATFYTNSFYANTRSQKVKNKLLLQNRNKNLLVKCYSTGIFCANSRFTITLLAQSVQYSVKVEHFHQNFKKRVLPNPFCQKRTNVKYKNRKNVTVQKKLRVRCCCD